MTNNFNNETPDNDEHELFYNDPYVDAYGELYKEQIRRLRNYIIRGETGSDHFVVLDLEAGLGKSVKTNKILRMYLDEWGADRNFLVVKRFKEDVEECAAEINKSGYVGYGDIPAALGITVDNWSKEWRDMPHELKNFRVLVITHARYQDLCLDGALRGYFTDDRHTLIIDEKMDFPIHTFSQLIFDEIWRCLPQDIDVKEQFVSVCKGLFKQIDKMKLEENISTRIGRCKDFTCHPATLTKFKALIEANKNHIQYGKQKQVEDFVKALEVLYDKSNRRLYNSGKISTINPKHRLWGLKNNIILDANGSIDYSYQVTERIRVEGFDKIVNHAKSKIHWIKCNTSASNIEKYQKEFFRGLLSRVATSRHDEKALVVSHLKFEKGLVNHLATWLGVGVAEGDNYNSEPVAVNHFYNLIGKNTYRYFEQCWIAGTSNVPMETHVLKWMHYSERDIGHKNLELVTNNKRDALRFENQEFDKMRRSFVIGEIYQCLKRVQRNPLPQAEFFVFTKAEDVYREVVAQMLYIEQGEKVELVLSTTDNSTKDKPTRTKADELADYLRSLVPGTKLTKKEVFAAVRIDGKNFYRMRDNIAIKNLVDAGIIEITTHHFIRI